MSLAATYAGAEYLIYNRKGLLQEFAGDDLTKLGAPARLFDRHNIGCLASQYDVLFFQTVFPGVEAIKQTPLVSVQYGLAKERHNYGEWRALADLNLMYGSYSVAAVSHFSPSYAVGNLKLCGWDYRLTEANKVDAKIRLGLVPSKPTVLYMPTYGELGSFDELMPQLADLSEDYQVIIKRHHNDEKNGVTWKQAALAAGHEHLYSGADDQITLLEAADIVISDFSGAIFDAVYAKLPVLLYQSRAASRIGVQKFDLSSLEFRERKTIGHVCTDACQLTPAIESILRTKDQHIERVSSLRSNLFVDVSAHDAIYAAVTKVDELLNGRLPTLSQQQLSIRNTIRQRLSVEQKPWQKIIYFWRN